MRSLPRKIFILSASVLALSFILLCYVLFNQPLGLLFFDKTKGLEVSGFSTISSFVVVLAATCMGGSEKNKLLSKVKK